MYDSDDAVRSTAFLSSFTKSSKLWNVNLKACKVVYKTALANGSECRELPKDGVTEEIWSKSVYSVVPMENYFLFIFVSWFQHGEASVSAACKWPWCVCLGSMGDANVSIELSLECNSDSSGVHTNMNFYLMRWALSFSCIWTNQHVTGLPTSPLQSQALCVPKIDFENHTFLFFTCHWSLNDSYYRSFSFTLQFSLKGCFGYNCIFNY